MTRVRTMTAFAAMIFLGAGCASGAPVGGASSAEELNAADGQALTDAYVWGYPLVVNQRTFQAVGGLLGVNSLFNQPALAGPATRSIVAPNHDTLYSVAVLDLRSEPVVLTLPDVTDRYWVFQLIDAWTNTFFYAGTRASGGKGGTFVVTPPGWQGTLPEGAVAIPSPTPQAFVLGRYLVRNDADVPNVTAIPRSLELLHTVTGSAAPPPPPALGAPRGTPQQVGNNGASFFDELGDALASNPPATDDDRKRLAQLASLGIGPGLHPAASAATNADALAALGGAVTQGNAAIQAAAVSSGTPINGWNAELEVSATPHDPLFRAAIAQFLWGANVPEEAVYAIARKDVTGQPLSGASRYVMHFAADQLPPVGAPGFWSVTLYGPDMFFVANAIKRYSVGGLTPNLAINPDGSLDIFVQNAAPVGHESNWLPAPTDGFVMVMRHYLPDAAVIDGSYVYPTVSPAP